MKTVRRKKLSRNVESALEIYERDLKKSLEAEYVGQAVAIPPSTGDYAIGRTHSEAAGMLRARHDNDNQVVTLTIGPPTPGNIGIALRIADIGNDDHAR